MESTCAQTAVQDAPAATNLLEPTPQRPPSCSALQPCVAVQSAGTTPHHLRSAPRSEETVTSSPSVLGHSTTSPRNPRQKSRSKAGETVRNSTTSNLLSHQKSIEVDYIVMYTQVKPLRYISIDINRSKSQVPSFIRCIWCGRCHPLQFGDRAWQLVRGECESPLCLRPWVAGVGASKTQHGVEQRADAPPAESGDEQRFRPSSSVRMLQ